MLQIFSAATLPGCHGSEIPLFAVLCSLEAEWAFDKGLSLLKRRHAI